MRPDLVLSLGKRMSEAYFNIGTWEATSENRRLVFPSITLVDVLQKPPLFGTGISGKEVAARYSRFSIDTLYAFGNDALAMTFTYLGAVGSAACGRSLAAGSASSLRNGSRR